MLVLCFYSGQLICVRVSFFVLRAFSLCYYLVVSSSAIDCMERLVPEMIYYVSSGMLTLHTHSVYSASSVHVISVNLTKVAMCYHKAQYLDTILLFSFPHCHTITTCIEMCANTYPSYLHKLETLNNKLLRILQNKPHNSSSNNIYICLLYTSPSPRD